MMRHYTGNAFAFMGVQDDWGRALSWPWETVVQGFQNLWPDPETIMVPALVARNLDLWCLLIVVVGIAYARVRPPRPLPDGGVDARRRAHRAAAVLELARQLQPVRVRHWVIYPAYASLAERLPIWWKRAFWVVVVLSFGITTYHMVGRFTVDRFVG